jgi:hypothetical protein
MNALRLAAHVADVLTEDGLDYAIGGALALGAHSLPRTTDDVDISVFIGTDELPRLFDSLERAGVMLDRADAIRSVARIGMFTARSGRTLVDVFVGTHPHFEALRARRVRRTHAGHEHWYLSADDLVVLKVLYGRHKDIADLERMFAMLTIDVDYVRSWITQLPAPEARLAVLDDVIARAAKR